MMNFPLTSGADAPVYLPMCQGQMWLMGEMHKFKRPGWVSIEFLTKTKKRIDEEALEAAVQYIIDKYENLRVKLYNEDGQWKQEVYPARESKAFAACDLRGKSREEQGEILKQVCIRQRDWLLPGLGNVIRIVFFRFSEEEGRIWFCMHHIVSDFVSLLTVSGDLLAAYHTLIQGRELKRQPCYDYRKWWYMVKGYARDVLLPRELGYWTSLPWERAAFLPTDYPDDYPDLATLVDALDNKKLVDHYESVTGRMAEEETSALTALYRNDLETAVIAAFFLALTRRLAIDCLALNVSFTGRNILPPHYGVPTDKLIGFIANVRALLLFRPGHEDVGQEMAEVMQQIGAIPNQGIAFHLLTHVMEDASMKASYSKLLSMAQIFFIYLGRTNIETNNEDYEVVQEDVGRKGYKPEERNSIFECAAGINKGQLYFTLTYAEGVHRRETVEDMAGLMSAALRGVLIPELT